MNAIKEEKFVKTKNTKSAKLFLEEDRAEGSISTNVIAKCIKSLGGLWRCSSLIILSILANALDYLVQFYILLWTDKFSQHDAESYQVLWYTIGVTQVRNICNGLRAFICFILVVRASRTVHCNMSFRYLHSKIGQFIERVPSGRIINRFSKDIGNIDTTFGWSVSSTSLNGTSTLVSLAVLLWSLDNYYLIIPSFIYILISVRYQRIYMFLKREVTRLQNITNSPVIGWCSTILKSCPEVRVIKKHEYVRKRLRYLIDENMKNSIIIFGLDAWFQIRLGFLNFVLIQVPSYGFILLQLYLANEPIDVKKLILFIISTTRLIGDMTWFLSSISNIETNLVSFERCQAFEQIEHEENYKEFSEHAKLYTVPTQGDAVKKILAAPEKKLFPNGKVEMFNLSAKYPTKPEPVLKNLTLTVQSGEKVGIVGRTGAGKTSFIKLFWKCLDRQNGKMLIDGKDIDKLDLKALRREIMVISQETALFAGTLRENIEPRLQYLHDTEEGGESTKRQEYEILNTLEELGFSIEKLKGQGLDFEVEFEGSNLSQGEKQIVCFMRAIAEKKKVIILDEATANIDLKTEKNIQKRIENDFKDSTMFIIAHRIQTVLSCDKILVLEDGRVKEFDTLDKLIADEDSEFSKIYQKLQEMQG